MTEVVLVTGAATPGVALAARHLADTADVRVVAVDTTLPADDLGSVKFVRADIRTPVIAKVLAVEDVTTVVHMDLAPMRPRGGATKEINVIGTMQVLAACQRSESIRRVVLASSSAVYGTSPRDPAVFKESATARGGTKSGFSKDVVEVESYTRGFARRRPDVTVTTLRMAQWVSPHFPTVLGQYFSNPVLPIPMGFDARLQLLHPDDAFAVIALAATSDRPGTFNVAGDGVLMLTQAARILGKPTLPLPSVGFGSILRRTASFMGTDLTPGVHRLLTYGRILDLTALREIFGYEPRHSTRETFEWFAQTLRPGLFQVLGGHAMKDDLKGIGTSGPAGRGNRSTSPSTAARSLAGTAPKPAPKKATPKKTTSKKAAPKKTTPADEPQDRHLHAVPDGAESAKQGRQDPPDEASAPLDPEDVAAAFAEGAERMLGADWQARITEAIGTLRRRMSGDYEVDEFGLDVETLDLLSGLLEPVAEGWFRLQVRGVENLPTEGGALLVANHSGTVPVDGLITGYAVRKHTGRPIRPLGADLVFRLPYVGQIARRLGATLACTEDAERLLTTGELAAVWPEGFKGVGKPFSERYKLQRFGRGGFVSSAMRAQVPIIPVSIVGAEEIYPLIGNIPALARLLGVPYIPITPFFPLLGPLGLIPLPSKWIIEFGEPIRTDAYPPEAADDPMLLFNVTDQVRETIQQTLYQLLVERGNPFI